MSKILSVIIPLYNEERYISDVLNRVAGVSLNGGLLKEILVIDDCSKDTSVQQVQSFINSYPEYNVQLINHSRNRGKGAAIHTGIEHATGDFLVIQDADLEYDPNDFNDLIAPLLDARADVVYGSRFIGDKPHRVLFFWHYVGNQLLTFLSNAFTNLNLTDMETCYKAFRTDVIKSIKLNEKRFGFEPEVTAKVARIPRIKVFEVGISYNGRTYSEGKKINWKDGFRAIYCILRYNLWK